MIRLATLDDMGAVQRLGAEFLAYSPNRWIPLNREHFAETAQALIEGAGAIFLSVLSGEASGFLGGVFSPCYFNRDYIFASELFWYGTEGQALREAWEALSRERGAAAQTASGLVDKHEPAIRRLYRAAGYEASEIGFTKRYR